MRPIPRTVAAIGMLTALAGVQVSAQTVAQPRFRVSVNAGIQPSTRSFDSTTQQPVYLERSLIHTTYDVGDGLLFDGGAQFRIAGGFGVGVAASWFSKAKGATVDAALPHPFFFGTPRSITGPADDLRREELATHLQAVYVIRPAGKIDVALAAGPSFFRVNQALVADVTFRDTYPYEAPAFTAAFSSVVTSHKTGFNAGADVGVRVSRNVGIGWLVRYSKAVMEFAVPNSTATVKADAGGLQLAGGVRLYF
jgi:hypothetical protein